MLLELGAAGVSFTNEARFVGDRKGSSQTFNFFGVHPVGHDYLELETGEVFRSPSSIRKKDKETISSSVTVGRAPNADYADHCYMTYLAEIQSVDLESFPSQIHFHAYLPADDFDALLANARNGILPSKIFIELMHELFGVVLCYRARDKYYDLERATCSINLNVGFGIERPRKK
jgi:hypothetical protein